MRMRKSKAVVEPPNYEPLVAYDREGYPLLAAEQDENGALRVWCRYCSTWHRHGRGYGHRVAHCLNPESPYRRTGYILVAEGAATSN